MDPSGPSPQRGTLGVLMLVIPIVSIVLVGIGYAVLFYVGAEGRSATGPVVTVAFDGCAEAQAGVAARVTTMGLPEPTYTTRPDGFDLTTRLPDDPRLLEQIPATLAARGQIEVRVGDDGAVLATRDDLVRAETTMAFLDVPRTELQFGPDAALRIRDAMAADLEGHLSVWVDGALINRRKNAPPEATGKLSLERLDGTDLERLDFAASMGIVLGHAPLPCDVTVDAVVVEDVE